MGAGYGDSGGPVFLPPPSGQIHQTLTPLGLVTSTTGTFIPNDEGFQVCTQNCHTFYSSTQAISGVMDYIYHLRYNN
jgi:hypothetical protein